MARLVLQTVNGLVKKNFRLDDADTQKAGPEYDDDTKGDNIQKHILTRSVDSAASGEEH